MSVKKGRADDQNALGITESFRHQSRNILYFGPARIATMSNRSSITFTSPGLRRSLTKPELSDLISCSRGVREPDTVASGGLGC